MSDSDTIVAEKYFIPKGSIVLLSRLGLGQNFRVWKESLKFKPKCHLKVEDDDELVLTDSNLHLLSFSIGRRGCPAVKLVQQLLARLLQGFTWALPSNSPCNDLIESSKINHFSTLPPRLAKVMYL